MMFVDCFQLTGQQLNEIYPQVGMFLKCPGSQRCKHIYSVILILEVTWEVGDRVPT